MGYKITRTTAKNLLKAAGYELADQFTDKVMVRKLTYLNDMSEEDAASKFIGPLKRVFSTLRLALRDSQVPEVVEDAPTPSGKTLGRPRSDDTVETTIIGMLKKADPDNPVTKHQVTQALVAKYPDRDPAAIKETVGKWIMSYCRRDGHDIQQNAKGYWINPE